MITSAAPPAWLSHHRATSGACAWHGHDAPHRAGPPGRQRRETILPAGAARRCRSSAHRHNALTGCRVAHGQKSTARANRDLFTHLANGHLAKDIEALMPWEVMILILLLGLGWNAAL